MDNWQTYGVFGIALGAIILAVSGTKFPWSSPGNRSNGGSGKAVGGRKNPPVFVPSPDNPRPFSGGKPPVTTS